MELHSKIFVAGHRGLVGSGIVRSLRLQGFSNLILRSRKELDLLDSTAVKRFFESERPEYVIIAAAKVGGIHANSVYPADFIYQNLQIQNNIIHYAYLHSVKKLLFLGSSCIYPKLCPQPIQEEYLLTGPLEPSNAPYALAKIAGIEMCESYNRQYGTSFISAMPTNIYGPNDNFHPENSHVIGALIQRFHQAKQDHAEIVTVWGTGRPEREFLFVDDLAEACVFLMQQPLSSGWINVGCGQGITIRDLAFLLKELIGLRAEVIFDPSKPDGTPKKILDIRKIKQLGWSPKVSLESGLQLTYSHYLQTLSR